ncbi:hypothetical protein HMPREF9104_03160 [Lentilactobacillus kisonensis F0435]|uniref:Uncharacterized protein n=1 Tax=Lentilactobacillus kisonensis F0435 TaxID=797516 RepID=H1LKK6_9LACO|nr:hypothetical protein HMPREF9104_03160 [Lentilactobacillus kisonensis F0435]
MYSSLHYAVVLFYGSIERIPRDFFTGVSNIKEAFNFVKCFKL